MSRRVQFRDTVGEIGVELSLFGGVQKGVLELVQRPVDAFDLEAFDDLTGTGLVFHQQRIVGFALFILGFLLGSFQVAQDDELLAGLVPICRIGVEFERDIFAPLVFGDTQPDGVTSVAVGFVVTTGKSDGMCTAPQKLDTFGVFFMKYNYEIRLKAVKLVLEGGLSVREAGCHLGCGRSQVHLWVTLFERHGLTGLKLRHGSYSAEFKLSVLKHMHQNHLSLLETAVHFGIPGPFVIRQWERLYQNQGAEGLRRKPQRRRPAMSKSKTKKVKLKTTPHEELLKELEYLRAENAYLKKLQALVEERIVRESGKEPKPSKD